MSYAKIIDTLYIADCDVYRNQSFLENVNLIISLYSTPDTLKVVPERCNFRYFDFEDLDFSSDAIIRNHTLTADEYKAEIDLVCQETSKLIHSYLQRDKKVVVQCQAGINRSALIIGYYLIMYRNLSFETAYQLMKEANNRDRNYIPILINEYFCQYLISLSQKNGA